MAASVQVSMIVERPPEETFDRLADMRPIPHFDADVKSVTKTSPGPIGQGTTFRLVERMPPFGRLWTSDWRYHVFEPDRRIGYQYTGPPGPIAPCGILSFERTGAGTRLTYRGDPHPRGVVRLLAPLIARWGTWVWKRRLAVVKDWLESERSDAPAGLPDLAPEGTA